MFRVSTLARKMPPYMQFVKEQYARQSVRGRIPPKRMAREYKALSPEARRALERRANSKPNHAQGAWYRFLAQHIDKAPGATTQTKQKAVAKMWRAEKLKSQKKKTVAPHRKSNSGSARSKVKKASKAKASKQKK